MTNDIERRVAVLEGQLTELSRKSAPPSKDFWDKLSALATLISSVVIGSAGVLATNLFNERQLDLKQLEATQQEARLSAQATQQSLIAQAKELETLLRYVSSKDDAQRAFGYAMFVALGQGDLAAKLIGSTRDQAGKTVVEGLVTSTNVDVASAARSALLSLDQENRLLDAVAQILTIGGTSGYQYTYSNGTSLVYGIDLWSFPNATGGHLRSIDPRVCTGARGKILSGIFAISSATRSQRR